MNREEFFILIGLGFLVCFLFGRMINKIWKKLWEIQDKIDWIEQDIRHKNAKEMEKIKV